MLHQLHSKLTWAFSWMNKWSNQLVKITKVSHLWKTQSQSLVQIPNPIYANLQLQDVNNFVIKIAKCWATPTSDQEGPILQLHSQFTISFMTYMKLKVVWTFSIAKRRHAVYIHWQLWSCFKWIFAGFNYIQLCEWLGSIFHQIICLWRRWPS